MAKGISPLVAGVLLVAFTVATALLAGGWLTTFIGTTTANVSAQSKFALACTNAAVSLEKVYLLGNEVRMLVRNTGFTNLLVSGRIIDLQGNSCNNDSQVLLPKGGAVTLTFSNCSILPHNFDRAIVSTNCAGVSSTLKRKSEFAYRKAIIIDNTNNSQDLTDYQILVENQVYNETGLVLSLHFDEGSGNVATDSSDYNNHGTINLGSSGNTDLSKAWVEGKFGKALSFDGVDDYVETPVNLNWSEGSIAVWAKPNDLNARNLFVYTADDGTRTHTHKWYHIVITWKDNDYFKLFVNGKFENQVAIGTAWKNGNKFLIGKNAGTAFFDFNIPYSF